MARKSLDEIFKETVTDTDPSVDIQRKQQLNNILNGEQKQSFLQDAGQDIQQTFQNIRGDVEGMGDKISATKERVRSGQQSAGRGVLQTIGQGLGFAGNTLGNLVLGAGKALLPQKTEEAVGRTVEKVARPIVESPFIQENIAAYEYLKENDPVKAADVEAAFGALEAATELIGAKPLAKAGKATLRATGEVASEGAKVVGRGARAVGDVAGRATTFATSQATGLSPDTLKLIVRNPEGFQKAIKEGVDRASLATKLFEQTSKSIDELAETGARYNPIRELDTTVELPENWLVRQIEGTETGKGFNVSIDDAGRYKVSPTTTSITRETADINAIEKFLNDWAGSQTLTPDEFLNMRSDLSKLSKFDRISGKTKGSETIAKGIRKNLNEFRDQIPGLKELDGQLTKQKSELSEIQKKFFNRDGTLKDDVANRLFREARKDSKAINDLKKIDPEIEEKINIARALEDVSYSSGQKVGTYARSALVGGISGASFLTGNIPLGIVTLMLLDPSNSSRIIAVLSKNLKRLKEGVADQIVTRMKNGIKLSPRQNEALSSALKSVDEDDVLAISELAKKNSDTMIDTLKKGATKAQETIKKVAKDQTGRITIPGGRSTSRKAKGSVTKSLSKSTTRPLTPEVKDNIVRIIDDYELNGGRNLRLQEDASKIAEDFGIKMPKKYGNLVRNLRKALEESPDDVRKLRLKPKKNKGK